MPSGVWSRAGRSGSSPRSAHKRFADIDEWQTEMQLKPMRIGSIQLYSDGLPEPERR